jgi:peptide/nickel transport system ATP-binding protein
MDLTVLRGQTVAVVGESGSGKSTAAAAILGLLAPGGRITGGRIVFNGRDITSFGRKADRRLLQSIRGREIGYVPQDPMTNLNPVWKVGFQIREALRANTDGRDARRRAVELLAQAGMPDPVRQAGRYPHQLSGGMCQRALIAIGLAGRPRLVIADEPTSALDVTVQRQVLDHLQHLTDELGTALLLITHDLALAAERAESVVVVHRGAVVESGAAREILRDPRHEYTRQLVAAAPSLKVRTRRRETIPAEPDDILVASELTKVYRESRGAPWRRAEFRAVDAVSFRLRRASTLAIVGESGSGKSTLARMVLGLLPPTSGTVTLDGTQIADKLDRDKALAFRRRIQPVFQNPYSSLDPRYTVYRAVEEPLRIHRVGDRRQREQAVRELVDQVALPSSVLGRLPRELSGGQRQRVAIARALALRPEVLVCDEAVSALDVLVQAQILDLLCDLQAQLGLTYLFISHDLAVIRQIADDVLVMRAGRVVEHAPTEELFSRPGQQYTRELLQAIPGTPAPPR